MSNTTSSHQISQLKNVFKWVNRWIVFTFRAGYGPIFTWPAFWGKIMVIENIGRKTGLLRYTPVNYALSSDEGGVFCLSGFGGSSHWYRNIQQNPQVAVWIGAQRIAGTAKPVPDSEQHLDIYRQVLINSGFAAPLFEGINPKSATESTLRTLAQRAPLVYIQLEAMPAPQRAHPGDLAWLVITLLFAWILLRPRRRAH